MFQRQSTRWACLLVYAVVVLCLTHLAHKWTHGSTSAMHVQAAPSLSSNRLPARPAVVVRPPAASHPPRCGVKLPSVDAKAFPPDEYGPQRCFGVGCYIADVTFDPLRNRLLVVMLGMPATDMEGSTRSIRKYWNLTLLDFRTSTRFTINDRIRSGYSVSVEREGPNPVCLAHGTPCSILKMRTAECNMAQRESATYECQLGPPPRDPRAKPLSAPLRVYIHHRPVSEDEDMPWPPAPEPPRQPGAPPPPVIHARPFRILPAAGSAGLMASSRRFEPDQVQRQPRRPLSHFPRVSACISGFTYAPIFLREYIQQYVTLGFVHVYMAMPMPRTSTLYSDARRALEDYIQEGYVSLIESFYTRDAEYDYMVYGHRSAFYHACAYHSRYHGDEYMFLGDIDEFPLPAPPPLGPAGAHPGAPGWYPGYNSIGAMISHTLKRRGLSTADNCAINLPCQTAVMGPRADTRSRFLGNRFPKQTKYVPSSVAVYGKSLHNLRVAMRFGPHAACLCEGKMTELRERCVDRVEAMRKSPEFIASGKDFRDIHCAVRFRSNATAEGLFLHFHNFFKQRKCPTERVRGLAQSLYTERWFSRVKSELERRERDHGIPQTFRSEGGTDEHVLTGSVCWRNK